MKLRRIVLSGLLLSVTLCAYSQDILKATNLGKFGVAPANYSGIAHISADSFAVVDDKSEVDGFYLFRIFQNEQTGKIEDVIPGSLRGDKDALTTDKTRKGVDCEGIAYVPEWNTFFISSENLQEILEYDSDGKRSGRKLEIPEQFSKENVRPNCGFEALSYNEATKLFWTTTEGSLKADGTDSLGLLRLQSFDMKLKPVGQWAYKMAEPQWKRGLYYTHGVSSVLALDDGRLLVLERELTVPSGYLGAKTQIKVFVVAPSEVNQLQTTEPLDKLAENGFLVKKELFSFTTQLKLGKMNYGNYEGMTFGKKLADGRQTLLLISDSQAGAGNTLYHLKDYLKVIILPADF